MRGKKLWAGLGIVAAAVVILGVVLVRNLQAEKAREDAAADLRWFCNGINLSGRWVSEDGGFSMLVYMDREHESRVRLYTAQGLFEGTAAEGADRLTIRADGDGGSGSQMELTPVECLDDASREYRIQVVCRLSDTEVQKLGEYVVQRDRLVDEVEQFAEGTLEDWIRAINGALSQYYGVELGVMDLELAQDGVHDANGGYVGYDGFVRGTGVAAPVSGGVFQLGSSEISFALDIAAADVKVVGLQNTTSGDVIVEEEADLESGAEEPSGEPVQPEPQEPGAGEQPGAAGPEETETGEGEPAGTEPAVSAETWKQAYYDVLMQESTYQYNGSDIPSYDIYLVDAEGNGVPELYVCMGPEPSLMLCQAYDASSGRLESAQYGEGVRFVPYVAVNQNTGERVLYGDNGGVIIWDTIILRPIPGTLEFEEHVISHTGKDWNEETQSQEAHTEQVSTEYRQEDFEVDYHTPVLRGDSQTKPSESAIREFLGL